MNTLFNRCPSCGGPIIITECQCTRCQLQMRGQFQPGPFTSLSDDETAFIRVFLSARGNLTEVERVLGVSYPTIRNKLDEINRVLNPDEVTSKVPLEKDKGSPIDDNPSSSESLRKEILQQVADGKLAPSQAIRRLEEMRGEGK
jgi:hypothetical protein